MARPTAAPAPLHAKAVEAATQLFEQHLPQWRAADAALAKAKDALPDFSVETNLLKVAAVNALYGTNLRAIHRMAIHIAEVLAYGDATQNGTVLVEALAAMPLRPGERIRTHRSFASKFAHFFIDEDRFPIMDGAACDALRLHLGRARTQGISTNYRAFVSSVTALRRVYGLRVPNRDLDRYLWIRGMHLRFAKGDREINRDLLALFELNPAPPELAVVTCEGAQRTPKGERAVC